MRNPHNVGLHQWAVVKVRFRPADRDEHPGVIISNDEHCGDSRLARVNILHGTKVAPGNPPRPHQVLLNSADGLEFLTAVDCSYFYAIEKDAITAALGHVGLERRRSIKRAIVASYRLHA